MSDTTGNALPEMSAAELPHVADRRPVLWVAAYACIVVLAWLVLELSGLGKAPFHTVGEPREGLVVWEMTHHGGWILPRRNGTELPSKPPLFHWFGAITSLLHGATDEWSIRFPSAGLSLLGLLCVYAAGAALWTPRAGLLSALALMTMFEWARAATGARVDMTLTFGLQLAFLSLLFFVRHCSRGWLVPLYGGITLAVLGKGPVGVALPGLVALSIFALRRDLSPLREMRLARGALTVGVLAGSWYVGALYEGGWAFFRKQVLAENVFTFLSSPEFHEGHQHGVPYLFGALLLGILPWTVLLPGVGVRLWRERKTITLSDARMSLLVWIVIVFGFYAFAASKRSVYLLALYPAVALLLGWWIDEQARAGGDAQSWLARAVGVLAAALLAVLVLAFPIVLLESVGVPVLAFAQRWWPQSAQPFAAWVSETIRSGRWPLLGLLAVAAACLYAVMRAARGAHWIGIAGALFCATAAMMLAVSHVILPGIARHQTLRSFMADVRQLVGPQQNVFFYKVLDYGAVFYWNGRIPTYDGELTAGTSPRYVLLTQDEWERQSDAKAQYDAVTFPDHEQKGDKNALVLIRRGAQD